MGIWLINKKTIRLEPAVDDAFILQFDEFCKSNYPYPEDTDPYCPCPWFFTESNELTSYATKFGEVSTWYNFLVEKLFRPQGYTVIGDPEIVPDFQFPQFMETDDNRTNEYTKWESKLKHLRKQEKDGVNLNDAK